MSEKCDIHVPKVQELWFQMKMNNLKHSGSKEDDQEMAAKRKAMVLSFQPVSLTFDYVNYYVEMPAVSLIFVNIHLIRLCSENKTRKYVSSINCLFLCECSSS
ncbi:hypothetical protein Hdeb2414_s0686g00935501 [Helianthus debilis subsp. tardiflorus]